MADYDSKLNKSDETLDLIIALEICGLLDGWFGFDWFGLNAQEDFVTYEDCQVPGHDESEDCYEE